MAAEGPHPLSSDPTDPATTLAPMVEEAQLAVVAEHAEDAVRRGWNVRAGARRLEDNDHAVAATVLEGWTPEILVMSEETLLGRAGDGCRLVGEGRRPRGLGRFGLAATVLTNTPRARAGQFSAGFEGRERRPR